MFAGKSSAACQVIRRNRVIGRPTLVLTSALDTRYSQEARITSHNQESYPAHATRELLPILQLEQFRAAQAILVEEAQFFPDLREFVLAAVEEFGKDVLCIGLDGDSERRPFGQLLELIPYADKFTKLAALCTRCHDGTEAIFTFRKPGAPTGQQVSVGGQDQYEPLCRHHYLEGKDELETEAFQRALVADLTRPPLEQLEACVAKFGAREGAEFYERVLALQGRMPSSR